MRKILETSNKVTAVFQGHSHKNELKTINEIPYCTLAAMIEGSGVENNSYALLRFFDDGKVTLEGYRRQMSKEFKG